MSDLSVPDQRSLTDVRHHARAAVWATGLLTLAVIVVRVLLARKLSFCGTPDACFYLGMGQSLASGEGFHARFLYDLQQAHPTLPNTGLEYWRPGVSLVLQLLKPLGGVSLHASSMLTILVGVIFAAAAWHIARFTYPNRPLALWAFALCLVLSPVWIASATPDSTLYYGAAVAWFLALFTVRRQGLGQDLLALVCAGLAYLIRNDGILLAVPLVAVLWVRWKRSPEIGIGDQSRGASPAYAMALLVGFLIVLVPMHLLYKRGLGTAFPSGTAQALFLNDLSDFGRYGEPATLHSLLAHGIEHLVLFRIATFATIIYRVAVLMIGLPALLFLPALLLRDAGQRAETADGLGVFLPEMLGPAAFGTAMLLVYTVLIPAVGGFSALRSAVALMPLVSVLVVVAIWRAARTPQVGVWLIVAVIAANAIAGLMETRRDLPAANAIGAADHAEAQAVAALGGEPEKAIVLTGDPVQFSVTTGYATVALPSNGLGALASAARDFHATHVILDSNSLPASIEDLERQLHPVRSIALPQEHSLILELPQTTNAH